MRDKKYYIALGHFERKIIINSIVFALTYIKKAGTDRLFIQRVGACFLLRYGLIT